MPNYHTLVDGADFVQTLPSAARTANATGSWVHVGNAISAVVVIDIGAVSGTSPTLDIKLQQATTNTGTGAKDITGATLPQITASGANKQFAIEINPDVLDSANGYQFIAPVLTVGGTSPSFTCNATVILFGKRFPTATSLAGVTKVVA